MLLLIEKLTVVALGVFSQGISLLASCVLPRASGTFLIPFVLHCLSREHRALAEQPRWRVLAHVYLRHSSCTPLTGVPECGF